MFDQIFRAGVASVVGVLCLSFPCARATAQQLKSDGSTSSNSIDERGFVNVNGVDEWLMIRGDDRDNPVLLYLHGGPGAATSVWAWPYFTRWGWQKYFTIAHWGSAVGIKMAKKRLTSIGFKRRRNNSSLLKAADTTSI